MALKTVYILNPNFHIFSFVSVSDPCMRGAMERQRPQSTAQKVNTVHSTYNHAEKSGP